MGRPVAGCLRFISRIFFPSFQRFFLLLHSSLPPLQSSSTHTNTTLYLIHLRAIVADHPLSYHEPYQRYAEAQLAAEPVYDSNFNQVSAGIAAGGFDQQPRDSFAEQRFGTTTQGFQETSRFGGATVEGPSRQTKEVRVERTSNSTVDAPRNKRDMGYYDDDGHYHSFRRGISRVAERIAHPIHGPSLRHHHHHHESSTPAVREEVTITKERETTRAPRQASASVSYSGPAQAQAPVVSSSRRSVNYSTDRRMSPNTITIPCHHIRIGDLLILQGRPCQVIRISTSAHTGQHRYLGVDLFTKQLHEESSFISNPAPSVIVQNMLGPVFKQYRVLDILDDGQVVAMTDTGDVKQGLPILDQSSLSNRLQDSFDSSRGAIRVLVLSDEGRELVVDYKIVHGSRL